MHPACESEMQRPHRHRDQRDKIQLQFHRPSLCDEPVTRSAGVNILWDARLPEAENLHPGLTVSIA